MAHYLIAHLNDGSYAGTQILSPEGVAELHHPAVEASTLGPPGWYGMGWYIVEQGQTSLLFHSGMIPSFYTYIALQPEHKKGVVLLVNANHFTGQLTLTEVGDGVTALLAGNPPAPVKFGAVPWVVRGLMLVPFLQIVDVVATLKTLDRWRREPQRRPSQGRLWEVHILPAILLNLIPIASGLALLTSSLRGFFLLFMPDLSWLALISGSFALVWTFLRTGLLLRATRN